MTKPSSITDLWSPATHHFKIENKLYPILETKKIHLRSYSQRKRLVLLWSHNLVNEFINFHSAECKRKYFSQTSCSLHPLPFLRVCTKKGRKKGLSSTRRELDTINNNHPRTLTRVPTFRWHKPFSPPHPRVHIYLYGSPAIICQPPITNTRTTRNAAQDFCECQIVGGSSRQDNRNFQNITWPSTAKIA